MSDRASGTSDTGHPWRKALTRAIHLLRPTEGDGAAADARRLLAHALNAPWLDLIKDPTRQLSAAEATAFAAALARRQRGEPVARIMGLRGFYGRDFVVTPATLDPRPETETLIDAALQRARPKWATGTGLNILDIGTGTGCLLLTLLAEFPEARGVGIDPSGAALAVARINAARHGSASRTAWFEGCFASFLASSHGSFSLIVSNPPYIPSAEIPLLDRDVRDFDPHLALDGGADGLDIYRSIVTGLPRVTVSGWVFLEIGHTQHIEINEIIEKTFPVTCIQNLHTIQDMAGKPRCVAFELRDNPPHK